MAKENRAAATIPGAMRGADTNLKARQGVAPERGRPFELHGKARQPRADNDDHIGQRQRDMGQ